MMSKPTNFITKSPTAAAQPETPWVNIGVIVERCHLPLRIKYISADRDIIKVLQNNIDCNFASTLISLFVRKNQNIIIAAASIFT